MDVRLRDIMIEAGYAAPEVALRAQKLAYLIKQDLKKALKEFAIEGCTTEESAMAFNLAAFYIDGMYGDKHD